MRYCAKCGDEFQDWVMECPDCHIELVDGSKPAEDKSRPGSNLDKIEDDQTHLSRDELVTIASFSHAPEAYVVTTRLQAEGILAFVADDYMVTMNWLYSNALGGAKVRVRESDAERAVRVLDGVKNNPADIVAGGKECPECNSPDISYQKFYLPPIFITVLVTMAIGNAFMLPFVKLKWHCNNCGYEWRNRD
jgi:hypothetical protein